MLYNCLGMCVMAWTPFASLALFQFVKGDLVHPHFVPKQSPVIPVLDISPEDIREAFSYAQDQQQIRTQVENKYIEEGNSFSPYELSTDIRIIGVSGPKTMQLDKNQKLFEDATMWLSKRYKLTQDETVLGLRNISLPEDLQAVQQCVSLKAHNPCSDKSKFRTADGSCNNLLNPNWGQAFTCNKRLMNSFFADGISSPRRSIDGGELPNGRFVTLSVVDDKDIPSPIISQMLIGFAHFLGHEVSLVVSPMAGDSGAYINCCPKNNVPATDLPSLCFPIPVAIDDPDFSKANRTCINLVRNAACSESCKLGTSRAQVNQQTSFIDASAVYGVSDNETRALRTLTGGALLNQFSDNEEMPPASFHPEVDQCTKSMPNNHTCIQTGDYRAIQLPGLTATHLIFFREHNRLAKIILNDYPKLSDEEIFQEVRRIVGAEIQMVAYKEMLPFLLGPDMMDFFKLNVLKDGYSEYNPKVDPRMLSEHAVSSARFGHTLAQNYYKRYGIDGKEQEELQLVDNNFRIPFFFEGKMDSVIRGLCQQSTQSFDRHFLDSLTNGILGAPGHQDGLDHIAFNAQREREIGVPSYTEVLEYCFNVTITSFDDLKLVMTEENTLKFQKAYRYVDDIDLYIGGFAEKPISNSVLGPTFACLTGQQYHNIKFGDRFFVEHGDQVGSFSKGQLAVLRNITLASITCANSGIGTITPNVFHAPDAENPLVDCTNIPSLDFKNWLDK